MCKSIPLWIPGGCDMIVWLRLFSNIQCKKLRTEDSEVARHFTEVVHVVTYSTGCELTSFLSHKNSFLFRKVGHFYGQPHLYSGLVQKVRGHANCQTSKGRTSGSILYVLSSIDIDRKQICTQNVCLESYGLNIYLELVQTSNLVT